MQKTKLEHRINDILGYTSNRDPHDVVTPHLPVSLPSCLVDTRSCISQNDNVADPIWLRTSISKRRKTSNLKSQLPYISSYKQNQTPVYFTLLLLPILNATWLYCCFKWFTLQRFSHWTEENIIGFGFLTLHQSLVLEAKQNSQLSGWSGLGAH